MQNFPVENATKLPNLKALLLEPPAKELTIPKRGKQTRRLTPQPHLHPTYD